MVNYGYNLDNNDNLHVEGVKMMLKKAIERVIQTLDCEKRLEVNNNCFGALSKDGSAMLILGTEKYFETLIPTDEKIKFVYPSQTVRIHARYLKKFIDCAYKLNKDSSLMFDDEGIALIDWHYSLKLSWFDQQPTFQPVGKYKTSYLMAIRPLLSGMINISWHKVLMIDGRIKGQSYIYIVAPTL